jgi:hypothetical protein
MSSTCSSSSSVAYKVKLLKQAALPLLGSPLQTLQTSQLLQTHQLLLRQQHLHG